MKILLFILLTSLLNVTFSLSLKELFNTDEFKRIANRTKLEKIHQNFDKIKIPFNCPKIPRNHPDPEDATKLRFSDIKVQMALGDSITAGFSMKDETFVPSIFEYRGMSGFIGADRDTISVYNFFKKIGNPMQGGSVGLSLAWNEIIWPREIKPHYPPTDKLNGAQSSAKVQELESQVRYVIRQAKTNPSINYEKDWKMMSILMGANNLFQCELPSSDPNVFADSLNKTFALIHKEIPRVFISIFYLFEDGFFDTYNNGKDSWYCSLYWKFGENVIPCMVKNDQLRTKMRRMIIEYNSKIDTITKYWNERRRKDFFISIQPMLKNIRLPDRSWSSSLDCFHPSLKANINIAYSFWNSLQLPFEKKPRGVVDRILCPDENTLIQ